MTKKIAICLLLLWIQQALAFTSFDDVVNKIKHYVGDGLVKAVCMLKRDCHQRVIYLINASGNDIQASGCHFAHNKTIMPGQEAYTAHKDKHQRSCQLTLAQNGQPFTQVTLSPHDHQISFKQQGHTLCYTLHQPIKSWRKCPKFCGKYHVWGYIAICGVWPNREHRASTS